MGREVMLAGALALGTGIGVHGILHYDTRVEDAERQADLARRDTLDVERTISKINPLPTSIDQIPLEYQRRMEEAQKQYQSAMEVINAYNAKPALSSEKVGKFVNHVEVFTGGVSTIAAIAIAVDAVSSAFKQKGQRKLGTKYSSTR